MTARWKTSLLLLLAPTSTLGCPPGTVPQQGVGWQGCAPVPGTGPSAPTYAEPREVWSDRWGAIAVDTIQHGSIGFAAVTGMKRKNQAEREALKACRSKGGTKCEVKISYYNQCAALIWGDHGFNTSSAPSEDQAKQMGMAKCNLAKEENCEVFYSGCSAPERVR